MFSYGYSEALRDEVVSPFRIALVSTAFTSAERKIYEEASKDASDARINLSNEYFYPNDWGEFFAQVQRNLKRQNDLGQRVRDSEIELCSKYITAFARRCSTLAEASEKEHFVGRLGESFASLSGTLVFTETKDSANRLAYVINQKTPTWPLTSDSSPAEREEKLRWFGKGNVKVLCAPRILDEGIDVPEAELAVIVAASQTRRQMIQRMGRVIRLKADGRDARLIILYVANTSEDPFNGGHEAFLDEILPFAREQTTFNSAESAKLSDWLSLATVSAS